MLRRSTRNPLELNVRRNYLGCRCVLVVINQLRVREVSIFGETRALQEYQD